MVRSDGKYVLLLGKYLWVFQVDGSFVAVHKTVRNPFKVIFLPDNTVLVDSLNNKAYYYICLETGQVLWSSAKKPGVRMMESAKFTVSPDGCTVFNTYYMYRSKNCIFHFDEIKPTKGLYNTYMVEDALRTSAAAYCDREGVLNVLQGQILEQNDPRNTDGNNQLHGLLRLPVQGSTAEPSWARLWTDKVFTRPRGCNERYILFEGLTAQDRQTGASIDLLQNDRCPQSFRRDAFDWYYDSQRDYLTVAFLGLNVNLIIDCKARKRVAQYTRDHNSVGFMGCLIGEEFWTATENGVIRRPFPHFDAFP